MPPTGQRNTKARSIWIPPGIWGGKFSLDLKDVLFDIEGRYIEKEDQDYAAKFDFRRLFSLKTKYSRFWHRYDTDYLRNLQAQSTELRGGTWDTPITVSEWNSYPSGLRNKLKDVKDVDGDGLVEGASAALWHSSYESTQKYGVRHSFWTNEAVVRLPALPGIQIGFKHRFEERRGGIRPAQFLNVKLSYRGLLPSYQRIH